MALSPSWGLSKKSLAPLSTSVLPKCQTIAPSNSKSGFSLSSFPYRISNSSTLGSIEKIYLRPFYVGKQEGLPLVYLTSSSAALRSLFQPINVYFIHSTSQKPLKDFHPIGWTLSFSIFLWIILIFSILSKPIGETEISNLTRLLRVLFNIVATV